MFGRVAKVGVMISCVSRMLVCIYRDVRYSISLLLLLVLNGAVRRLEGGDNMPASHRLQGVW